ncbi:lipase family protein [Streptomyces antimycoticus]|uniref:hypothetical protein n=1 Tax=Streptomyces antimycoticus TaxID=68175 RepID=UPI0036AA5DDE
MVSINGGRKRLVTGVFPTVAAGAAFGAFALSGTADGATRTAEAADTGKHPKPTIVLEHGAFADGSSWNGVLADLRVDGYPVVAAANPLRGPASDAAALRTVLDHVKGPKILVAVQRFMAKRAHAHITEVAASHSVAVSHPHLVADMIEKAARATVR